MTALSAPEKGLSWKSIIIATIAVVFVVVLLAAIFTSRSSVQASGRTSTSEQLFPPQYVTTPTPVVITTATTNSGSSGSGYFSANGSANANSASARNSGNGSYAVWHDTYKAVAYNANSYQPNYPTWQNQYGYNYYPTPNYGNYGNYPTWHDPYPYGYPQGYATYQNYPVWHN